MSARCGWCWDARRQEWERRLTSGEAMRSIALDTPFSVSAGNRHVRHHMNPELLKEMRATTQVHISDFTDRLAALTEETAQVRAYARQVNDPKLLLSAVQAERETLNVLLARLGVDDTEAVAVLREAKALASALAAVLPQSPAVARALSEHLERCGHDDLSQALASLSAGSEVRQIDFKTTDSKERAS